MKIFKLKSVLLYSLLSCFILSSCSSDDDASPDGGGDGVITHEDVNNFYEFRMSGGESGTTFGKPTWVLFAGSLGTLEFSNTDYRLSIVGNNRYSGPEESGWIRKGVPIVATENNRFVAKLGTYPITPLHTVSHDSNEVSLHVYFQNKTTGKKYGPYAVNTTGNLIITDSDNRYYEGTFDFKVFEEDGPSDSSVTVKGKFRMSGGFL
ncbi:MAG: hypothetical protein ABI295_06175 [Xanthomarina sp.]